MFLTNTLLKRAKTKLVLALLRSTVTGHVRFQKRERIADKIECIAWDPLVRANVLYKEAKKVASLQK